jgi:hypothetical protein
MKNIHWARVVILGFLSELAVFAVFVPATVLLGELPGMYSAVIASLVMPFFFGMWAAAKLKSRFVLHGMLVGVVGVLIYIGLSRGQPEPMMYIVAHGLKLLGGAAGGFVIQKRREREILPIQG